MTFPCSLNDYADSFDSYAAAIADARRRGLILCKYADPTEDERRDLTDEEAAEIAGEDIGLIFVDGRRYAHWISADGQGSISVAGLTHDEAMELLLSQCGTDEQRAAILAGRLV